MRRLVRHRQLSGEVGPCGGGRAGRGGQGEGEQRRGRARGEEERERRGAAAAGGGRRRAAVAGPAAGRPGAGSGRGRGGGGGRGRGREVRRWTHRTGGKRRRSRRAGGRPGGKRARAHAWWCLWTTSQGFRDSVLARFGLSPDAPVLCRKRLFMELRHDASTATFAAEIAQRSPRREARASGSPCDLQADHKFLLPQSNCLIPSLFQVYSILRCFHIWRAEIPIHVHEKKTLQN